jgi:hypothetical protein
MALLGNTRKTTVATPRGCLKSISTALKRLASNGDVAGFRAYVASDAFLTAFAGLDPGRRQSGMRAFARAEALCEAKAHHPLVKPKPIDAKRAEKVNWSDPVMRGKLADVYARVGGDDEKAARILGVTLGSARLAKKRHLRPAARDHA